MVRSGRVPPSLLFCGPSGVGKLQAAMTLAKALNCSQSKPMPAAHAPPASVSIEKSTPMSISRGQKVRGVSCARTL